jgi:formylglycine-generating enzyme required for sulfatase activity
MLMIRVGVVVVVALGTMVLSLPALDSPKVNLPAKNFTEALPGGTVKFEMVYVPGGEFLMGSPEDEAGRDPNEGPQHKVSVKPYWLGKCEVSWDEFDLWWKNETLMEFPKDAPYGAPDALTRPTNPYVPADYGHGQEGYPAICMSHHAAMMYCHWLRTVTKKNYRLPTEAEWEFAARAGTTTPYSCDADKLGDYAQSAENSKDDDHPKGTTNKCGAKKPNKFGLYDMHGNVAEWVLDLYDPTFYKSSPSVNPVKFPGAAKWGHIVRGGSFKEPADKLRSATRRVSDKTWMKFDPQAPQSVWWLTKRDEVGFRLALPVEELPALVGLKPMVEKKVENDK